MGVGQCPGKTKLKRDVRCIYLYSKGHDEN
jgi:hypothetical protein